ncbi:ubiquinone-dependent pyruvate dehydrogenase [bacterium]|nr:ubiquinone-dependent pyruvate dehydrogenase [bacterium]
MFHTPTVADAIIAAAHRAGARRVYGIIGDSINPVVDAVARHDGVAWVHVRNEEAGAFAAGAEAQLTGTLAVCAGSCGPGGVHLLNGVYDAHRSGAPVLVVVGHIPSEHIGTGFFQETHPTALFAECSHYCELVTSPAQATRAVETAIQHALTLGGAAVLVLPGDVAALPAAGEVGAAAVGRPRLRPAAADVDALADLLNGAEKVALFAGIGCADAREDVLALADVLKAPVGYSLRGKPFLEYDNPFEVGMNGLLGWGAAYAAAHACDAYVLLGTDFPYPAFLPTRCQIAQIDVRAERLGRRCKLALGVTGDVGETIRALLPKLRLRADTSFLDAMLDRHAVEKGKLREYVDHVGDRAPLHPEFVAAALSDAAAADAVFTVDTGMTVVWACRYVRTTAGRQLIGSFNHGSMANALPQAIGAQLAYPGRQVVAMCGDGGFAMLMGEILTVRQLKLPIKVVVFNNGTLGMVRLEQAAAGYVHHGDGLDNPDFARLAEAVGLTGIRIEQPGDLRPGLERALATPGPVVVDVVTDPNTLSLPPTVTAEQVAGYALSAAKLVLSGRADEVAKTLTGNWRTLTGTTGETL